jgi:hypothetical protein
MVKNRSIDPSFAFGVSVTEDDGEVSKGKPAVVEAAAI